MLDHGDDNVAGLLEQGLVVPVGVDLGQLLGDQVVLPENRDSLSDFLFVLICSGSANKSHF